MLSKVNEVKYTGYFTTIRECMAISIQDCIECAELEKTEFFRPIYEENPNYHQHELQNLKAFTDLKEVIDWDNIISMGVWIWEEDETHYGDGVSQIAVLDIPLHTPNLPYSFHKFCRKLEYTLDDRDTELTYRSNHIYFQNHVILTLTGQY